MSVEEVMEFKAVDYTWSVVKGLGSIGLVLLGIQKFIEYASIAYNLIA